MATQTITVTNFEQVPGRSDRLHFASMLSYTGFTSISVITSGDNDLQWNFVGYNSGGSIVVDQYWFNPGYDLDLSGISYMDQVVQWELWIRHSGNGSIDPLAISSAVCTLVQDSSGWYVGPDGITNEEFLDDVPFMAEPFPLSIWQCDPDIDAGFVYCPLFPDAVAINPVPVQQIPYIMVYDITTPQTTLALQLNNGLAILVPSKCEDTEELCGAWTLSMEHPIDPEGRWKLLQEGNILRAGGQLFTIKYSEEVWEGNTGKIAVDAEHIFYQFADNWIFADPFNPISIVGFSDADVLHQIDSLLTDKIIIQGGQVYSYRHASDVTYFSDAYYQYLEEGRNPVDLILGDGGLISAKGGELHRDNFYFSIKKRKEGSSDHAFDIRVGKNMKGIKQTIDTTSLCTYFRLTEANTGSYVSYGWDTALPTTGMWRSLLPHHIVRSEVVSYPTNASFKMEQLAQDAYERFKKICMPFVCYEIDLEDVRDNPDFEITATESIRCGDIGQVYDKNLGGSLMLEVTGTTYDRITGRCKSIVIGQKQSFVYHPTAPIVWDDEGHPIEPESQGGEIWVRDSTGRYLYDSNGVKIVLEVE